MRFTAFAALLACPFVACYCTLSLAEGAEARQNVVATCAKSHVSLCVECLGPVSAKAEDLCAKTKDPAGACKLVNGTREPAAK
ncbi:MAG TPA: hypothetical protein VGK67_20070 [Myxococcales bacterium]|jgi:hypothetical protein